MKRLILCSASLLLLGANHAMAFSYTETAAAFASGAIPQAADISGAWKMVGIAVPGTDPDQYNANGLTNPDGSFYDELQIQEQSDAVTGAAVLSIGVDGLGNSASDQGPFTANIASSGLSFETYGYTNGCQDDSITFPRVCKMVSATGAMICHEDDTNDSTVDYSDEYDVYVHE